MTSSRSSKRTPPIPSRLSIPGSIAIDISRDEALAPGEAQPGLLVYLETRPLAEPEVEPVGSFCPGSRVRWVGWPARSMTSAAMSYRARPVIPGTRRGARRLERLANDVA